MMEDFDIKDSDIEQSDLSSSLYAENQQLNDEKRAFDAFIKDIYSQQIDNVKRSSRRQRDYSKKSENHQNLIKEKFQHVYAQQIQPTINGEGEGYGEQREETEKGSILFNPFEEFLEEIVEKSEDKLVDCIRDSDVKYTLQGLDNSAIDFDKLKVVKNKLVYDKVHNNIQTITFLISGYMTQDTDAKDNYKTIVDDKAKSQSPKDFYVNFRWQSSSPISMIKQFFGDLGKKFILGKSDDNKRIINFCENYLSNVLKNSDLNPVFKNVIYFLIRSLLLFINTPVLSSLCQLLLELFIDLLNSIIKNFELGYDMAKKSGKKLSEVIKKIKSSLTSTPVNIDLFGHSLGTVVIQRTLSNFEDQKLCRYVILMGGVTTIEEMLLCTPTFEKCLNYYSYNDQVLKQLLINGEIIGAHLKLSGLNPFNSTKGNYFDRMLTIGHTDYNKQYSEFIDIAHQVFNRDQRVYRGSVDFNIIDSPTEQADTADTAIYMTLAIPFIALGIYLGYRYFKK